jgi:predicted dienelactone hydrolase
MEKLNKEAGIFKGRLDMNHVGVAGHSFGAYTTMAVAGEVFGGRLLQKSLADPRVKAAIPMSTPSNKLQSFNGAYDKVAIPCMHMTGTLDDSPIGNSPAKDRRIPFDQTKASEQYLITFIGGDHMIFSGRLNRTSTINDKHFQSLIMPATTAFWDAYLKDDPKAKAWLQTSGLKNLMGADATVEMK